MTLKRYGMIQEKFIPWIKEAMNHQAIPPSYNPNEWADKKFNCYAYALRLCIDLDNLQIAPGLISKEKRSKYRFTKKYIVQCFMDDCETLGLQAFLSNIQEQISPNEYKIAIYVKKGDIHFTRQDSNGGWSEKDGWSGNIEMIEPENITKTRKGYKFVGVFRVSKK